MSGPATVTYAVILVATGYTALDLAWRP